MRDIAIVGAGQAGLLLGIGLLGQGYRVTLVSDRTAEEILHGRVPAGAVVFHDALELERELGIALWEEVAMTAEAVQVEIVGPQGETALGFGARLDHPALCVDQRLKSARWMEVFQERGGRLVVKPATVSDLEAYARDHDLVVVAAGKGETSQLFPRDEARSPFASAPRQVSMVMVRGIPEAGDLKMTGIRFRILPGIGEIFSAPMYTKDLIQGAFLGFEAIPGGPMDRVKAGMPRDEHVAVCKELFRDLLPREYEAVRRGELVDDMAYLSGAIVPIVRRPCGVLPSGAVVMGIGDAVNLHDPMAAQGANNAAKMARLYRDRIVARGQGSFDAAWMQGVFEEGWEYMRHCNVLCEKLLAPPEPHMMDILGAASQIPKVASSFVNGFNHPPSMFPWFVDAGEARRFIASAAAG